MIGTKSFGALQGGGSAIDVPVAALAGLSIAFLAFAAPADILADLISSSGLPSILSAAEPPLGLKARIGIGAVGATIVFALAFILLRWLDRFGSQEPVRARPVVVTEREIPIPRHRRRDHHPDAPERAPLHATFELGEPALDPWPEPRSTPKRESELVLHTESEPNDSPEPEPQWTPDPVTQFRSDPEPQSTFDPEPQSVVEPEPQAAVEPEPQSMPEPVAPWPSAPEPPAAPPARPGPLIELEADPVENAWRLSRPYDPIVREKQPSAQAWPQLEDEDEAELDEEGELDEEDELEDVAELEPEAEYEEEAAAGFEAGPEAEDVGLIGNPWQFRGEPDFAPPAEIPDEPLTNAVEEPEEEAPEPEPTFRRAEPAPAAEPEAPAAFVPPPRDNSVEALLARLEQGMARRREEPVPQAPDTAPVVRAPTAPQTSRPDPADDRLQSAIEKLQRLATRRD